MSEKDRKRKPTEVPTGSGLLDRAKRAILGRKYEQDRRMREIFGDGSTPDQTDHPEYRKSTRD